MFIKLIFIRRVLVVDDRTWCRQEVSLRRSGGRFLRNWWRCSAYGGRGTVRTRWWRRHPVRHIQVMRVVVIWLPVVRRARSRPWRRFLLIPRCVVWIRHFAFEGGHACPRVCVTWDIGSKTGRWVVRRIDDLTGIWKIRKNMTWLYQDLGNMYLKHANTFGFIHCIGFLWICSKCYLKSYACVFIILRHHFRMSTRTFVRPLRFVHISKRFRRCTGSIYVLHTEEWLANSVNPRPFDVDATESSWLVHWSHNSVPHAAFGIALLKFVNEWGRWSFLRLTYAHIYELSELGMIFSKNIKSNTMNMKVLQCMYY